MRFLLTILILMNYPRVFAFLRMSSGGGMATGGGAGVVCRDRDSNIESVQLLDLYEAQVRHRSLVPSTGDVQKDYIDSVLRTYFLQGSSVFGPPSNSESQSHYKSFIDAIHWTARGVKIPLLRDQGEIEALPQNCYLEQIAIFHGNNVFAPEFIEMQTDLWERLPALHKAALIWHELLYKYYRLMKDSNSEYTRAEVAYIFTAKGTPVLGDLPSSARSCTAYDESGRVTQFFIFSDPFLNGKQQWRLQFTQLMGRPLLDKTFAVLEKNFPQLSNRRKSIGESEYSIIFPVIKMSERSSIQKVSLFGAYGLDLELTVEWSPNEPIALLLHRNERLLGRSFVSNCSP